MTLAMIPTSFVWMRSNLCTRFVQLKSHTNLYCAAQTGERTKPCIKLPAGGISMEVVFRIRHAAKMAGISPGLLRAWERRYRLVQPRRTASGYRVYSPEDVELLSAAARLVSAGHSISEVARLSGASIRRQADQLPAPSSAGTTEPA